MVSYRKRGGRKVAFVSTMTAVPWGGSEVLWARTASVLREAGLEVAINVKSWPTVPAPLRQLQEQGCQVSFCTRAGRAWGRLQEACRVGSYAKQWLSRTSPDLLVVSCAGVGAGVDWMETSQRLGIPYVVVNHSMFDEIWPDDQEAQGLARAFEGAASCCFVSATLVGDVEKRIGTRLPNQRIVRNPYNVSYDVEPSWPASTEELKLAFVGRLDGCKGVDILFDVLGQQKWRDRPVRVSLYGEGPNARGLRQLARAMDLGNVNFAGQTNDVCGVWKQHHALVLPSRLEAMPLVIVEAMLCARPCVVTDVGGVTEIVRDGETGYVAVAAKARWVDQAMERLWQNRTGLQAMGLEARRQIRELVPPHPAQDFARHLTDILSHSTQADLAVASRTGFSVPATTALEARVSS